jgi:hypothetical protein
MKVLEKGTGQKTWAKRATCAVSRGGCGAKLLVEATDIYRWTHHDYGGGLIPTKLFVVLNVV